MRKGFLAIIVLALAALFVSSGSAQEPAAQTAAATGSAAQSAIPPEAAKQANPVKPGAESLARGKKDYGFDCAMCHGANGDGKGDLAVDMKLSLKDYRDPASLKGMTDGEIFYVIKNGKGEMKGEGDRRKASELWDIVNYVRQLRRANRVDQALFDRLQKRHGTPWLVELTAFAGYFAMLSGVVNAFDVDAPADGDKLPA